MKKSAKIILSLVLCFTLLFCSTASPVFVVDVSANNTTIKVGDVFQSSFDKLSNVLIDVVNRFLLIIRFPWETSKTNTIDLSKFRLVFDDEFNGNKISSKVWRHYREGARKGGYWDSEQSFIRDGKLVIRTEYKENGKFGAGYYTDRIDTKNKYMQTYGYFECRCILPAAKGMWSAFWLTNDSVSVDGSSGKEGAEIDVFESPLYYKKKNNNLITSNIHYSGYGLQTKYKNVTIAKAVNPYEEFNTYGLEWNEDGYIFYINGVETGRSKFGGVSRCPEYMILSCEIDGVDGEPFYGWSGVITKNKKNEIPAEFVVDYVRAYQYK